MENFVLYAHHIDITNRNTYPAQIIVENGFIKSISPTEKPCEQYILPGFIDAHIHIESSMLVPSEFARIAVQHGTVATVSDPHEIANVCGIKGIEFMLQNAKKVPFKFFFGAPSCVPATLFESAGATIDSEAVYSLLKRDDIYYLSEMMNYPGVLFNDEEVLKKIEFAKQVNKPIDGHAPGLMGDKAIQYIQAGISTDHECYTAEEALHKLKHGMHILIREGSAAKNMEALIPLLAEHPHQMMFCCDDKHPDELVLHHINFHVKKALEKKINLYDILQAACINPVLHYKLPVGLLKIGDPADFILINNPSEFKIEATYINGIETYRNGKSAIPYIEEQAINNFSCDKKSISDFQLSAQNKTECTIRVIEAIDTQLITQTHIQKGKIENGYIVSDTENDILKIVVVNRYKNEKVAIGFIKNFNLKKGAIGSTIAHDSHNIIVVGTDDESICQAVNTLIENQGGIVVVSTETNILPMPIAGIMSNKKAEDVAEGYSTLDKKAKELGCQLKSPFMTLSFMALLVIPQLKLSDKGLFDGEKFQFVNLISE
ncbi:MAG: adenine deaminase [Chitinophagaceae bacterium]